MSEWFKEPHLKCGDPERVPSVRIRFSPLTPNNPHFQLNIKWVGIFYFQLLFVSLNCHLIHQQLRRADIIQFICDGVLREPAHNPQGLLMYEPQGVYHPLTFKSGRLGNNPQYHNTNIQNISIQYYIY
jgi:hypothetical protein